MISYIIPTHQRHESLADTLHALGRLPPHRAEVIVVDNASVPPIWVVPALPNGLEVRAIHLSTNEGAAARNVGAREAAGDWIVML
ncbi:MAG: glycosyltransferase, partial [Phycisphaerales bacterium]|nr:glycosyltransferase [Phycisphaerales bacterium]